MRIVYVVAATGVIGVFLLALVLAKQSEILSAIEGRTALEKVVMNVEGQPTCASVPVPACGLTLKLYQKANESAEDFSARIKQFVKDFEREWGS